MTTSLYHIKAPIASVKFNTLKRVSVFEVAVQQAALQQPLAADPQHKITVNDILDLNRLERYRENNRIVAKKGLEQKVLPQKGGDSDRIAALIHDGEQQHDVSRQK